MKATLTYEGKTVEVEIAEEKIRKIFEKPKTGWERVKFDQTYYYISGGGLVAPEMEKWNKSDYLYYNNGNYFTDKNLANDQARAISLWLRIKRWAAEHCEPMDWEGRSGKYSFYWDYVAKKVRVSGVLFVCRTAFAVYFDTPDRAKQCIEEFRDELTWYFTECKDRMDG